jgi:hypothetical protein
MRGKLKVSGYDEKQVSSSGKLKRMIWTSKGHETLLERTSKFSQGDYCPL